MVEHLSAKVYWPDETKMSSTEESIFDETFDINCIDNNQRTDYLYKCNTCCKLYKSQRSLVRHIRYECGQPPQFHCPYCTEKSHRKYNLEVHIKLYWHDETQMSSTEVIAFDQRFGTNSADNNQRTDLYICHMCCKTYKLQSSLVRHIKYECGKPPQFHCPYCTEKSHHKYNLEVHIKRKHKQVQESLVLM
ncbi:serendipity locus protein beta-like isoform X2 [Schistocerca gregaria]|uniref:serendipity locus protein beta-like isoform X2 n=1 Tax=Schistocerca gregaria TaxID=7010 RepID=UPI00211DBD38|nr:serendipity locus protein beta-like isoform X2 [Schistocerca gregaria]